MKYDLVGLGQKRSKDFVRNYHCNSYSYGDYGSHSILLRAADRLKVIIRDKELIPIVIYSLGNSLGKEEEINLECILESYNPPFELSEFLLYHHLVEIYLCLGAPAVSV